MNDRSGTPKDPRLSRRRFLGRSATAAAGLALGPVVLNLSACGTGKAAATDAGEDILPVDVPPIDSGPVDTGHDPGPADHGTPDAGQDLHEAEVAAPVAGMDDVVLALHSSADAGTPAEAVRKVCEFLDFSWMKEGDTVFVKLAVNSGKPHPATTAPAAVTAMVAELYARGAKKVIVGDQSGVENVRLAEGDQRFSSTYACLDTSGLLGAIQKAGAEDHCFDDKGYDTGYFPATWSLGETNWKKPVYIANIVKEVDHIVYLPRISSHAIAGYTNALKCSIGWLRDDSRCHLHTDGATIYEKWVEVNYVDEIRSKLRLVLTLAESALLDYGPDEGTVTLLDPWMIVASGNLAHHDAVTSAIGLYLDRVIPKTWGGQVHDPSLVDSYNKMLVSAVAVTATGIPWGDGSEEYTHVVPSPWEDGILSDRALVRAFELNGGKPGSISVHLRGMDLDANLKAFIEKHGEGIVGFVAKA